MLAIWPNRTNAVSLRERLDSTCRKRLQLSRRRLLALAHALQRKWLWQPIEILCQLPVIVLAAGASRVSPRANRWRANVI